MPFKASASQRAWVRPVPHAKKVVKTDQKDALRGPIAYLACQPKPKPRMKNFDEKLENWQPPVYALHGEDQGRPGRSSRRIASEKLEREYIRDEAIEVYEIEERQPDRTTRTQRSDSPPPSRSRAYPKTSSHSHSASSDMNYGSSRPPTTFQHYKPRYDDYYSRRRAQLSSARSVSSSWASATTPLDMF